MVNFRSFSNGNNDDKRLGRQSELLYNEELFKIFQSIKHLLETPDDPDKGPDANLHGALWLNLAKNELNYYDKPRKRWMNVFQNKFDIFEHMMDPFPPDPPKIGQLWLNNDILMFFDGANWRPIKAIMEDGSNINLSTFEDFLLMSPLVPTGNTVVNDGKTIEKSQFLVPSTEAGRFYINKNYVHEYEVLNRVSFQHPNSELENNIPSWVHVNPGKLTNIKKRLFIVDGSKFIPVPAFNTEYYGFTALDPTHRGYFLRPINEDGEGEYEIVPDGIYLTDSGNQFQYVLAITYEFSWIKSSGRLNRVNSRTLKTSYYVGSVGKPTNVFIEGYDLENRYYTHDEKSGIITITDPDMMPELEVSIMHTFRREYGIIKDVKKVGKTTEGTVYLKCKEYKRPILFVNGQALLEGYDYVYDEENRKNHIITNIKGAKKEMVYTLMETYSTITQEDGTKKDHKMFVRDGFVDETAEIDGEETSVIFINNIIYDDNTGELFENLIDSGEQVILFVDGLLVNKADIEVGIDDVTGHKYITVLGLTKGMEFIVLYDRFGDLFEGSKNKAIVTDKVDESLVFLNGRLLCNDSAVGMYPYNPNIEGDLERVEAQAGLNAYDNQVAGFVNIETGETTMKYWDCGSEQWHDSTNLRINGNEEIANIISGYKNLLSAVMVNYDSDDQVDIYAYNFANTIDEPLYVDSIFVPWEADDADCKSGTADFTTKKNFPVGKNALSVFVNGVRQYYVQEKEDGSGFILPEPVTGKVTYIIEYPEHGEDMSCERIYLGPENVVNGTTNVYTLDKHDTRSLFPGRITVYIAGIRQPRDSFVVLDNRTILFKDRDTKLIGSSDNYPEEYIVKDNGDYGTVHHNVYDDILIEIRQEFRTDERTIDLDNIGAINTYDIITYEHNIPETILEAQDEILIFVDGLFTGYREGIEYEKNRANTSIKITEPSFFEFINTDPLYDYLIANPDKLYQWEKENGKTLEREARHRITFEWR